jgi:hypothetical protein
MSSPAQRLTDSNNAGGSITNTDGNSTVYANNLLISVNGSIGTGHGKGIHSGGAWQTSGGSPNVLAHNVPINYTGNTDTCGHPRVGGSGNVYIGTANGYNFDGSPVTVNITSSPDSTILTTSTEGTFIQENLDGDGIDDSSTSSYVATQVNQNVSSGVSSGVLSAESTGTTSVGTSTITQINLEGKCKKIEADWKNFNNSNIPYNTLMLTPATSLADFTTKTALWANQPNPLGPNTPFTSNNPKGGDNKHIIEQDFYVGGVKKGRITVPEILHNMSNLALNIWEPFKKQYPQAIITNVFRQNPPGGKNNQAQHGLGMAMDIQVPGASAEKYLEAAQWIRDNLCFDQLLQEKAGSTRWLHVSHYSGFGYQVSPVNKVANCIVSPSYSFVPGLSLLA